MGIFQVIINSLECQCTLLQHASETMRKHCELVITNMLTISVDSKIQIKVELFKLIQKTMQTKGPQAITEMLTPYLDHKSPWMKEDVYNYIIFGLLQFPSNEFDLEMILTSMVPGLMDNKRRVRQATLEGFAVIYQVINLVNWLVS